MSHIALQGDGNISRVDNKAVREGIGERLRAVLDPVPTDMPLYLLQLLKQF